MKIIFASLLLLSVTLPTFAQKAAISFKDHRKMEIQIQAFNGNDLMTKTGNIKIADLDSVEFKEEPSDRLVNQLTKKGLVVTVNIEPIQSLSGGEMIYDGSLTFQKIYDLPGKSASEIYQLGKRWVAITFKNSDAVTQSVLENEMIRGEGYAGSAITLSEFPAVYGNLKYQFQVDVKDGRMRFRVYSMEVSTTSAGSYPVSMYTHNQKGEPRTNSQGKNVMKSVTEHCDMLVLSLDKILLGDKKDDDW